MNLEDISTAIGWTSNPLLCVQYCFDGRRFVKILTKMLSPLLSRRIVVFFINHCAMQNAFSYMNDVTYKAAPAFNLLSGSQNSPDEKIESIPICLQYKT